MKSRTLILLNYQRTIPPFVLTEISFAKEEFSRIIYITRKLTIDNSALISDSNVEVVQVSRWSQILTMLILPFLFLRKEILHEIYQAIKDGKFEVGLIKNTAIGLFASEQLYLTCKHIISKYKREDLRVLCVWFDSIAYAGARIKKNLKVQCASFAHSYEIDPLKSKYVGYQEDAYKNIYLDSIYFISERMIDVYKNATNGRFPYPNKTKLRYLGSIHRDKSQSAFSRDGVLRIVSCSGIIPVKRLEIIIDTLREWDTCNIEWTHLGGGPLFENFKMIIKDIENTNPHIKIHMSGVQRPNTEIQEYYRNNIIDLFVNVSASEGLPVSIMEAISFGIPCIGSNVGGTSEIVNSSNGYLLSADATVQELSDAIMHYLNSSIETKIKMRNNAFEYWSRHFNADINAPKFYNEINN